MRAKQIAARKARNQELARIDALHRCSVCREAFNGRPMITRFGDPNRYCSTCYRGLYTEAEIEPFKAEGA